MGTPQKASNFADLIHKVARSCLLHPVGHKFGDGTDAAASHCSGDSSDITTANNRDDSRHESVEVFPLESGHYENLLQKLQGMEALIADMFDSISSLKSFYVRLQAAHSPYDPERLHEADSAVVAELKRLSDLKQLYRRNKGTFGRRSPFGRDAEEQKKVFEAYEDVVKDLRNEVREKNLQIEFLKETLRHCTRRKDQLERRLSKRDGDPPAACRTFFFECPTPQLFESAMEQVKAASKAFTKLLISLMKTANWDIEAAVSSIEPGVAYAKKSHRRYAFQSYVCQRMFHGFENETFYITGSLSSLLEPEKHRRDCFTQFRDMQRMQPAELLNILPDCAFGKFCNKKYLCIVHPKMEEAFFKNLDHRNQIVNGNHPRTHFYENFLGLCKAVWLLHKLAFSFNPVPSHFHVKRDAVFQPVYMESVAPLADLELQGGSLLVAFAVTPGFKLGDSITKSQVYLITVKPPDSR